MLLCKCSLILFFVLVNLVAGLGGGARVRTLVSLSLVLEEGTITNYTLHNPHRKLLRRGNFILFLPYYKLFFE